MGNPLLVKKLLRNQPIPAIIDALCGAIVKLDLDWALNMTKKLHLTEVLTDPHFACGYTPCDQVWVTFAQDGGPCLSVTYGARGQYVVSKWGVHPEDHTGKADTIVEYVYVDDVFYEVMFHLQRCHCEW